MARATKTPRNTDSSKFKEAVKASAKKDKLAGTGVLHEDGAPVYLEALTEGERQDVGDKLAKMLLEIAEKEQKARDDAGAWRNKLKKLREQRDNLRDEWLSGKRKRPAQGTLPGTVAT
jgi:hypothetical protein